MLHPICFKKKSPFIELDLLCFVAFNQKTLAKQPTECLEHHRALRDSKGEEGGAGELAQVSPNNQATITQMGGGHAQFTFSQF